MTTVTFKVAIAAAIVLLLLGGGYGAYRVAFDTGLAAGKAQADDACKSQMQVLTRAANGALAEMQKDRDDAIKSNEAVYANYAHAQAADAANAAVFARRLQDIGANNAALADELRKANRAQGSAAPSGSSGGPRLDRVFELLADAHAECAGNAARLDALELELNGKVDTE